jgi:surface polysaccharide O-acyltransferase-like enzyme
MGRFLGFTLTQSPFDGTALMSKAEPLRQTGPEILRILLMLMIITHHLLVHGLGLSRLFFGQSTGNPSMVAAELFLNSFVVGAVNCFILISGYFGIRLKARSLSQFLLQAIVYSVGIVVVFRLVGWNAPYASIFLYWFLVVYLALMGLSPFLNRLIDSLSDRELASFLGTLLLVVCGLGFAGRLSSFMGTDHGLVQMITMYVLGHSLRRFESILKKLRPHHCLFALVACGVGVFLPSLALFRHHPSAAWSLFSYENPLIILSAIALFLLFVRAPWQWKHARTVSTSVFGIYLLHDNERFRELVIQKWVPKFVHQPWEVVVYIPAFAVAIFLVGWLIDFAVLKVVAIVLDLKPLRWIERNVDSRLLQNPR